MGEVIEIETQKIPPFTERAEQVIEFLNKKTGRRYPARNPQGIATSSLELIIMRIKEGYTVEDCKSVIAKKWRDWGHDEKMYKFVSPQTLFRRSNFERYIGELE